MSVEIKNVVIGIGDKEISLTVDEVKELMKVLQDTFGTRKETVYRTVEKEYVPIVPWPWGRKPYVHWDTIWCGTTGTLSLSATGGGK